MDYVVVNHMGCVYLCQKTFDGTYNTIADFGPTTDDALDLAKQIRDSLN